MKRIVILSLISTFCILISPVGIMFNGSENDGDKAQSVQYEINPEKYKNAVTGDIVRVFNADTKSVTELDFRDYIIGVVAGEMPVEFHEEALSACAVAAATLTRKKMSTPDDSLNGADISTDPAKHQAYMSLSEMKERWGESFDMYYEKLCAAVDKSIGYSVVYDGELITAVYHSVSTGITEDAENVWMGKIPYLISVNSDGDRFSPRYASELFVKSEEFKSRISEAGDAEWSEGEPLISDASYTAAGRIKSITAGGVTFNGEEFRKLFSLRSAAVTYSFSQEGVLLKVKGYGHGVGLSQYGADYYARQGKTWQEIIKHYYTGVEIVPVTKG